MVGPSKPNVLIIALDCVRADHLGCYGYRGTACCRGLPWCGAFRL